jgi:hypothetical protein
MTKRILAKKKIKMHLNTLKDMEETALRLKLKQDAELAILMLIAYREDATLRQIKNAIPLEYRR